MSRVDPKSSANPVRPSVVPPLRHGDRLTRPEFERRFDATPGLKNAELIEGIVYMPPPVSHSEHSEPHTDLIGWLVLYKSATPGVSTGDNGSLRLDLKNMPQPDAYLLIKPECGGQALIEDGYVTGGPELIGEIAASSVEIDLGVKFNVYQRTGVREYIVWRTRDRQLDYFILRNGQFERFSPDAEGTFRSETFPGLWLHAPSLLAGNLAEVLRRLQDGLKSPQHAAFAEKLRTARPKS